MFRKPVQVQGGNPIKSSAVKKLKAQISEALPTASAEALELLLPAKAQVLVSKCSNKALLYSLEDGVPLFIDATNGKGDMWPTVFALWKVPDLIPELVTGSAVSERIIGGADLMLPGVIVPAGGLRGLAKGERRCIRIHGNPFPMAVGLVLVDVAHIAAQGMKGKALEVVHTFGDSLSQHFRVALPPGFSAERIVPAPEAVAAIVAAAAAAAAPPPPAEAMAAMSLEAKAGANEGAKEAAREPAPVGDAGKEEEDAEEEAANEQDGEEAQDEEAGESPDQEDDGEEKDDGDEVAEEQDEEQEEEEAAEQVRDAAAAGAQVGDAAEDENAVEADAEEEEEEEEKDGAAAGVSAADMDAALHTALCFAIKHVLTDADLPVSATDFFSKHLALAHSAQPDKRGINRLDMKLSSFKKLAKFIKEMTKKAFISSKLSRGALQVTSVSAAHPDIKSIEFSPAVIAELQKARDRPSAEAKKRAAAAAAAAAAGRIKVLTMYMPSNSLKRVLFAAHPHGTLFTMGEAKHVLWEYVKAHQLERGGGRAVAIDEVLFDALFKNNKGAAKAGAVAEVGSELAKQALSTRFEAEMAAYHALVREGEEAQADFRRGKLPQVEVVTERRQGTKVVTRLSNLEVFGVDPAAVAKHAQKVFACSATVQPSLLKDSKLRDVLVQGSVLGQVEAVLTDEFGIPPNLVVSRDSAAKKKKKK